MVVFGSAGSQQAGSQSRERRVWSLLGRSEVCVIDDDDPRPGRAYVFGVLLTAILAARSEELKDRGEVSALVHLLRIGLRYANTRDDDAALSVMRGLLRGLSQRNPRYQEALWLLQAGPSAHPIQALFDDDGPDPARAYAFGVLLTAVFVARSGKLEARETTGLLDLIRVGLPYANTRDDDAAVSVMQGILRDLCEENPRYQEALSALEAGPSAHPVRVLWERSRRLREKILRSRRPRPKTPTEPPDSVT